MNKPNQTQAYSAIEAQGNDYSHAGCLMTIINAAIQLPCKPRRVRSKMVIYFVSLLEKVDTFRFTDFRVSDHFAAH